MNYGVVFYILGWILKAESVFMIFPFAVGLIYREDAAWSYLITAGICLAAGILLSIKKPKKGGIYLKEGFFVVGLGWLFMSMLGALPFVFSGDIPHYIDALFETASGFSTTGASILPEVEKLSHAGIFWRSFTHLLGGMGVFAFLSALLPMLGGNSMNLMKAESTGPSVDKLVPKLKDTAKILYSIYLAMGVIECIILLCLDVSLFDSLCYTFGTIGTGGFSIKNDGCFSLSPAVQWVIGIFMVLSGINYSLYFLLLKRKFKQAFSLEEVRLYLAVVLISVVVICINIRGVFPTAEETVRQSFFQVSTLITSTGYATCNYDLWPEFSKCVLLLCMFMGSCAGSTGGGIKMSRILIMFKSVKKQIQMLIHPRAVSKIKIDGSVVEHDVVRATNAYIVLFTMIFAISTLLVSLDGFDFTTNFTSVLATLNNMGPGLNLVGPTCNFGFMSDFSKIILTFDMLAGRLELFPMLLIIIPRSWRRSL